MTQFEAPEQYPGQYTDLDAPAEQRTSGLAIGSLISSLVCCCPITTVLGIILGIAAVVSIGGNPQLKGRGLAITGIILGVIFTLGSVPLWYYGTQLSMQAARVIESGADDALSSGFAGDYDGFRNQFYGDAAAASDAEVEAFIDELRQRYGEFVSAEPLGDPSSDFGAPELSVPYRLTFADAQVDAEAELVIHDPDTGEMFIFRFGSIRITDPDLGDIEFPQPAQP